MKNPFVWFILLLIAGSLAVLLPEHAEQAESRRNATAMTGGDPEQGRIAIGYYGCGSCHTIRGVRGASALVGPPLTKIGARAFVAGVLPNTPDDLEHWIIDAPSIDPKTAMPNVGVSAPDARDIAAYLYTLR
jgi:cytochrome c